MRLSNKQRRIVEHDEGALLVVAGPGAGKTRVLTERVRRLLSKKDANYRVLALTFTNKAASEMKDRLKNNESVSQRSFIGTLHAFCMEVLANRGRPVGIEGLPNIFESFQDRRALLREAIDLDAELRFALAERGDHRAQESTLYRWMQDISEWKRNLTLPSMLTKDFDRRIYEAYNAQLAASGGVDFDDLLLLTYRLFEENPQAARFYRRQYRYICIDEAQDLNEAQYRVLCALCTDQHRNVMLVGDPKQAIYTWNGADPKYLDLFVEDFEAETTELNENFRSSRAVVHAAQVLESNYEVAGQLPIQGDVLLQPCDDEEAEAEFVIETIEELQENGHQDIEGPIDLGRIAVLGRNRFVFDALLRELERVGIPYYQKMSAASHEFVSDVVQEFQLALRIVANPHDRLHLGMLCSRWKLPSEVEGLRARFRDEEPRTVLHEAAKTARGGNAAVVAEAIIAAVDDDSNVILPNGLAVLVGDSTSRPIEEREFIARDIQEWEDAWKNYLRSTTGGSQQLASFLSHVALGTTEQASREGLALITVHSSKGMEFDVVFVIGMSRGTFPDYRAKSPKELAEERRNAFVACTRSQRLLYVSYPRVKLMPWGDSRSVSPSPFFTELADAFGNTAE